MTARQTATARIPVRFLLLAGALCTAAVTFTPAPAAAEDDVLANSPVVRRQLMPRAGRHEVAGLFGLSVGDPYVRNLLPGVRYDWHLFDWLAVGGRLQFGIPLETAMFEEIDTKVARNNETFEMEASSLRFIGLAHASVSPLVGKLLTFSSLPVNFDLHFDLSIGIVGTGSTGTNLDTGAGISFGAGGGVRIFLSRVLALTFDLQAITADRPLSVNRDSKEVGAKTRFNTIFDVGLSFFMPPKLSRGD